MPLKYFGNYASCWGTFDGIFVLKSRVEIQCSDGKTIEANQLKFGMIYHLPLPFFLFPEAGLYKIWKLPFALSDTSR
jgi:hypothetical protein